LALLRKLLVSTALRATLRNAGFGVFTVVLLQNEVFWCVTPCLWVFGSQHFGDYSAFLSVEWNSPSRDAC